MFPARLLTTLAKRAAPAAARTVMRPVVCSQWSNVVTATNNKWFSSSVEKEEDHIRSIDAKFVELENSIVEDIELPARVSGVAGEHAAALYRDTVRSDNFIENCAEMVALHNAVNSIDPFVARVFRSSTFAPEECWESLRLLLGDQDITTFDALPTGAQAIVEDEMNIKKYQEAQDTFAEHLATVPETAGDHSDVVAALGRLCNIGRLDLFGKTKDRYFDLVKAAGDGVTVTITSAVPLTAAQTAAVQKVLPKYVDEGKYPIVSFAVDPTVLGGVMLQVENMIADTSSDSVLRQVSQTYQL